MSGSTGHLKAKFVGNHGDKLTVGRLAAGAVNGVSEIGVQNIYVSAVPSHLVFLLFTETECGFLIILR